MDATAPFPGSTSATRAMPRGRHPWPDGSRSADGRPAGSRSTGVELDITVERHRDDRPVVRVAGELDDRGAPLVAALLEHVLSGTSVRPVLVDLGEVGFVDTHGLAPLLVPGVRIQWASPAARRVLRLLDQPAPGPVRAVPPGQE